jgi:hypothetical protein
MIKSVPNKPKWLASSIILVIAILLVAGCPPSNQSPAISSLTASEEQVSPSGSCQVESAASDPDGDELSYTWSASGGNISREGSTVTWTAPETSGNYTITVKVTDGKGGEATAELTIAVAVNHPPVIDSLTAEPQVVRRAMTSTIECIAQDPDDDELGYTWSASGGNITGEEPTITWVAPNAYDTYTITVTVTDGRGGEATQSVDIEVTCGCGG